MNFKKMITSLVCVSFLSSPAALAGEINWFSSSKTISYGMMAMGIVGLVVAGSQKSNVPEAGDPVGALFATGSDIMDGIIPSIGVTIGGFGVGIFALDLVSDLTKDNEVALLRAAEHRSLVRVAKSPYSVVDESSGQVFASFLCGQNCESAEQRESLVKSTVIAIDQLAQDSLEAYNQSELSEEQITSSLIKVLPEQLANAQSLAVAKLVFAVGLVNQGL